MTDRPPYVPACVFISGASVGFGAAFARRFAGLGSRVVLTARRAGKLEQLAAELGERALPLELDVRDAAAVRAAPGRLPPEFADVDCLINNAGLAPALEPAQHGDPDDWANAVATNCTGLAELTRAFLPAMVARGGGHVINIGSVAGTYPYAGGAIYGATKAFVRQFSLDLRSDLHGTGVRVSNVEPGLVGGTEFSEVRFGGDTDRAAAVYAGVQALTPDDIAEAVVWLATQPPRVNVNRIEIMPVAQSFAGFQIHREA